MIFFNIRIEIFLLGTIYFAMKFGALAGLFWGFGFGLLEEVFSSASFGTNLVPHILLGFLTGVFKERLYFENLFYLSIFIFFALIFGYLVQFIFSGRFSFFMVLSALISALVSTVIFFIIKRCA